MGRDCGAPSGPEQSRQFGALNRHVDRAAWLRYLLVLLLCAAMALPAARWDAPLLDALFALQRQLGPQAVLQDVVLVGIDDAFIDSIDEPLALSHRYLAQFLTGVAAAGPAVIALDLSLPEKRYDQLLSRRAPEADYHRQLLGGLLSTVQQVPLVVAKAWDVQRGQYRDLQLDYAAVLALQGPPWQGAVSALMTSDPDGRLRRYPEPALQPDGTPHTLSSAMAAALGQARSWRGLINYQLGPAFQYVPLQQVLQLVQQGQHAQLRQLFHGRAVLLGSVLDDLDQVQLPVPLAAWRPGRHQVPGMLVHAQTLRSMLNGGLIAPLAPHWTWLGCLAATLFWCGTAQRRKVLGLGALALLLLVLSALLLRQRLWLAPAAPLACATLALLARAIWQAWCQVRERQRLSRTFGGSVSPHVMRQILDGSVNPGQAGRKVEVCVLFSDVRNFTGISEQLPAEQLVALLNRYFARMTAAVHQHGGTVDKFIGDGMMAFFGAPNALAAPEQAAFAAACAMLAALAELNRESLALQAPALTIGIGLHCGPAVIGYIGSAERHEYTAIGSTVNAAARIEGLCKSLEMPLLCSQAVVQRLPPTAGLEALGPQLLRGHSTLALYGWRPPA
ncbi:MAG: CHASE2 domain-containing protein [Sphingomonadaceae bacterium]